MQVLFYFTANRIRRESGGGLLMRIASSPAAELEIIIKERDGLLTLDCRFSVLPCVFIALIGLFAKPNS